MNWYIIGTLTISCATIGLGITIFIQIKEIIAQEKDVLQGIKILRESAVSKFANSTNEHYPQILSEKLRQAYRDYLEVEQKLNLAKSEIESKDLKIKLLQLRIEDLEQNK